MQKEHKQDFETTQGTVKITLKQLNGIEGPLLLVRLVKQHGPAMGALVSVFKAEGQARADGIGEAVVALSAGIDEKEVEALLMKFIGGGTALIGGEFVELDRKLISLLFTGLPLGFFELLAMGFKTNYEDFFGAVAKLIPATAKQKLNLTKTTHPPAA